MFSGEACHPEENEWSSASKLRHAADVVQDYMDGLSNKSRLAARVGGQTVLLLRLLQMQTTCKHHTVAVHLPSQTGDEVLIRRLTLYIAMLSRGMAEQAALVCSHVSHSCGPSVPAVWEACDCVHACRIARNELYSKMIVTGVQMVALMLCFSVNVIPCTTVCGVMLCVCDRVVPKWGIPLSGALLW